MQQWRNNWTIFHGSDLHIHYKFERFKVFSFRNEAKVHPSHILLHHYKVSVHKADSTELWDDLINISFRNSLFILTVHNAVVTIRKQFHRNKTFINVLEINRAGNRDARLQLEGHNATRPTVKTHCGRPSLSRTRDLLLRNF